MKLALFVLFLGCVSQALAAKRAREDEFEENWEIETVLEQDSNSIIEKAKDVDGNLDSEITDSNRKVDRFICPFPTFVPLDLVRIIFALLKEEASTLVQVSMLFRLHAHQYLPVSLAKRVAALCKSPNPRKIIEKYFELPESRDEFLCKVVCALESSGHTKKAESVMNYLRLLIGFSNEERLYNLLCGIAPFNDVPLRLRRKEAIDLCCTRRASHLCLWANFIVKNRDRFDEISSILGGPEPRQMAAICIWIALEMDCGELKRPITEMAAEEFTDGDKAILIRKIAKLFNDDPDLLHIAGLVSQSKLTPSMTIFKIVDLYKEETEVSFRDALVTAMNESPVMRALNWHLSGLGLDNIQSVHYCILGVEVLKKSFMRHLSPYQRVFALRQLGVSRILGFLVNYPFWFDYDLETVQKVLMNFTNERVSTIEEAIVRYALTGTRVDMRMGNWAALRLLLGIDFANYLSPQDRIFLLQDTRFETKEVVGMVHGNRLCELKGVFSLLDLGSKKRFVYLLSEEDFCLHLANIICELGYYDDSFVQSAIFAAQQVGYQWEKVCHCHQSSFIQQGNCYIAIHKYNIPDVILFIQDFSRFHLSVKVVLEHIGNDVGKAHWMRNYLFVPYIYLYAPQTVSDYIKPFVKGYDLNTCENIYNSTASRDQTRLALLRIEAIDQHATFVPQLLASSFTQAINFASE